MSNVDQLRRDVKWWTDELRLRQEKVREAVDKLKTFQDELMRAEREEADRASHKKAA